MEKNINLRHSYISFIDRTKYYLLLLIGLISFGGLISIIDGPAESVLPFLSIMSFLIGIVTAFKIYRTRFFLLEFNSYSEKIDITYLKFSKEFQLECPISDVDVIIVETSSKFNFNCKLILTIEDLDIEINSDFNWGLDDLKKLFVYIKYYKNSSMTEKEKHLLQRLDERLLKVPF